MIKELTEAQMLVSLPYKTRNRTVLSLVEYKIFTSISGEYIFDIALENRGIGNPALQHVQHVICY